MLKKIAVFFVLVFSMMVLVSCNTMHGLGKDIEGLGNVIKDAAD